jgi:5,10-methylenetetrahydrofolate reductase
MAEIATPRGLDLLGAVRQAQRFRDLGAIAVNVPDYPRSGARASALALSVLTESSGGVETMLHYCARDRTLLAMQSELVGAHAMGLRNILLTTGRPAQQGAYADESASDVDAIGLTNMAVRLNRGLDIGGQSIGAPTRFHIGVAVNPFAPHPETEWRRLGHKVEAGAEFIVTPPVLDIDAFAAILPKLTERKLPILAGVAALETVRQTEFLASEVVGVRVAESLLDRMRRAADPAAEGLAITREIIDWLRHRVQGIQITALHGSPAAAENILAELQAHTRTTVRPV